MTFWLFFIKSVKSPTNSFDIIIELAMYLLQEVLLDLLTQNFSKELPGNNCTSYLDHVSWQGTGKIVNHVSHSPQKLFFKYTICQCCSHSINFLYYIETRIHFDLTALIEYLTALLEYINLLSMTY